MIKSSKYRLVAVLLYLAPIIIFTIITRTITGFTLSAGIMTILLGLCFKFIPDYIGNIKELNKNNGFIFITISGILLVILASM
ncbi:MAG: hypothetical protein A2Y23_10170 [Clostridiales bacterium GWB2_37_7]|nr:MAG: hypothetical protein A2Y23_10170 [Clostridiales bacterium GWB2_37_7]